MSPTAEGLAASISKISLRMESPRAACHSPSENERKCPFRCAWMLPLSWRRLKFLHGRKLRLDAFLMPAAEGIVRDKPGPHS
jgi:hypothetical protein